MDMGSAKKDCFIWFKTVKGDAVFCVCFNKHVINKNCSIKQCFEKLNKNNVRGCKIKPKIGATNVRFKVEFHQNTTFRSDKRVRQSTVRNGVEEVMISYSKPQGVMAAGHAGGKGHGTSSIRLLWHFSRSFFFLLQLNFNATS